MTIETLIYSNYLVHEKKQSEIDADYIRNVAIGFRCPRCKGMNQPALEHAEIRICPHCKLSMQLHGNALTCSTSPLPDTIPNHWRPT